ncbi:FecR protein [Anaerohalosphaera lusitana]|uniref:FecR protein n=1 Tax=Anaerohalosphaera lusitana TaxID=1936003 RepID=A0A1U9NNL3_9BACT|nr:NPCBM/NEW2 domain-containing protein [Anaerohalosphaera lusitana]AQT69106.1 FecR protein [Anaerohalosphaera lusitana]
MALSAKQKKEIMDLLILSLDDKACRAELESLRNFLEESDEARDYYIQAVSVVENIRKMEWKPEKPQELPKCDDTLSHEVWQALAEQEKIAPTVEIPSETPDPHLIENVVYPPAEKKSLSKLSIATLAFSVAALLFFAILVRLPVNRQLEVATLKDSINARWGASETIPQKGDRLMTGSRHSLLGDGFVSLQFDSNAAVTIEGPAEFEIISDDRIKLHYGQLYSIVPQEAIGFSVATPNSMIIDLGTQFGVGVDFRGNTALHVNKGKTMLISGENQSKKSQEVPAGLARKVSTGSMEVSEIPCESTSFVRQIDSTTNMIWRGESEIDLTDMFCGGNGLGTSTTDKSINPVTGELVDFIHEDRKGSGEYILIPERRYVDGVFVPDGNQGSVVVSSEDHVFTECPPTNNIYYFDIHKGLEVDRLSFEGVQPDMRPSDNSPQSIMLHANLGITFDLRAIRNDYPLLNIDGFKTWTGISENADRQGNADVWVLVDGEIRYSKKQINEKGRPYQVQVELKPSDRFLTLIATDGGDKDLPVVEQRATDSDWCLFVEPKLITSVDD